MSIISRQSVIACTWVTVTLFTSLQPSASRADDALLSDVQRCAAVAKGSERLACFDALAGRHAAAVEDRERVSPAAVAQSPPAAPPPVSPAKPEPAASKTLDDISTETQPKPIRDNESEDELLVRARVTRCEKDARKKYYFVFDNGEVWKQVSDKRLRYRECEFGVTITKDFFGYKMQPDGEKGRIRIARIK